MSQVENYIKKAAACIIKNDLFNDDRECLVKDPTADVLEITTIIDRNSKIGIRTAKLGLKSCQMIKAQDDDDYDADGESNTKTVYEYQFKSIKYSDSCPPDPLRTLCRLMLEYNLDDHFVAFAYFCERLAQRHAAADYAAAAAAADYAAADYAAAAAAADYAAAAGAAYAAARAADYAAAAGAADYAEIYRFLCVILKNTPMAEFLL